jgi:hypothetical protein
MRAMPFEIRNLSVLDYTNGFTLWHYKSIKDTKQQIGGANYFAPGADMLSDGNMIIFNARDGHGMLVVTLADTETAITAPMCMTVEP